MTIDFRYVVPVVAFYAPGTMLLVGGWALGFTLAEMKSGVAMLGGMLGFAAVAGSIVLFESIPPMRVRLF